MYRKKRSIYRVWYYLYPLGGGLGIYPLKVKGAIIYYSQFPLKALGFS